MSDMNYRNSYEYPHPNRKQVALLLSAAKTPAERKVWRDLLNSSAFDKVKSQNERIERTGSGKKPDSKSKKK